VTRLRPILLWALGSLVAILICASQRSAAYVDGAYIPSGNDSFYHAHRILTAAQDLSSFYEFDPNIHAPEGSLLIWPWGYDYAMALLVKATVSSGMAQDPMQALAWIPVWSVGVSIALVLGIAISIGLKPWAQALAVACAALSPLTQFLHGLGCVDHHFVEFQLVLAALWSGILWLQRPESLRRALLAGAVLGAAPMVHDGLFILQVPMLLSLGLAWMRGAALPARSAQVFIAALLGSTLLVLLPSVPFREGRFEFFLLSWFHLYVAACSAVVVVLLSRLRFSTRSLLTIALAAALLAVPLLRQALLGQQFVSGQLQMLDQIEEARSVAGMIRATGLESVIRYYSGLVLTAPLVLIGCLGVLAARRPALPLLFFLVFNSLGVLLLLAMFRMHNYGSYALYLPGLLAAQGFIEERPQQRTALIGLLAVGLLLAYAIPIRKQLLVPLAPGNDFYYGLTRAVYPPLAESCAKAPGTVLAAADDGHYITYHTRCAVITDNFLMTRQHEEKFDQVQRLMALTPAELVAQPRPFRYVFVRFTSLFTTGADGKPAIQGREQLRATNPRLVSDLLLSDAATWGPRYRLITEKRFSDADGLAYARVFELLPPAAGTANP
jgi:hypothetical protein